jgi:hypothetical protein
LFASVISHTHAYRRLRSYRRSHWRLFADVSEHVMGAIHSTQPANLGSLAVLPYVPATAVVLSVLNGARSQTGQLFDQIHVLSLLRNTVKSQKLCYKLTVAKRTSRHSLNQQNWLTRRYRLSTNAINNFTNEFFVQLAMPNRYATAFFDLWLLSKQRVVTRSSEERHTITAASGNSRLLSVS